MIGLYALVLEYQTNMLFLCQREKMEVFTAKRWMHCSHMWNMSAVSTETFPTIRGENPK